jgi:hypothetical protein
MKISAIHSRINLLLYITGLFFFADAGIPVPNNPSPGETDSTSYP